MTTTRPTQWAQTRAMNAEVPKDPDWFLSTITACLSDLGFKVDNEGRVPVEVPTLRIRHTRRVRGEDGEWSSIECPFSQADTSTVFADVLTRPKRWWE